MAVSCGHRRVDELPLPHHPLGVLQQDLTRGRERLADRRAVDGELHVARGDPEALPAIAGVDAARDEKAVRAVEVVLGSRSVAVPSLRAVARSP